MAHMSGKDGQADAAGEVVGMRAWSLEYTVVALDTTDFADAGVSAFIPGRSEWHGSFEGLKNTVPLTIGTEVALKFWEATGGTDAWNGQGIVTVVRANCDHDGLVTYSYDFQGTGVLTIPT